MRRIFPDFAYGPGPRDGCWWDETCAVPDWPELRGAIDVDVTVIGAGYTGLSAALHLAESGAAVAVLEAETPGWGASGRNGGFCCLGGGMLDDAQLKQAFGAGAGEEFRRAEQAAVDLVARLLARLSIDADRHSQGETQLAHRPKDMAGLREAAERMRRRGGPAPTLIEAEDLPGHGFGGRFFGALTTPSGFALNPRKYLSGLARAAQIAGARAFQRSAALRLSRSDGQWRVATAHGSVTGDAVVVATNAYSSEDLPDWLGGRFLPAQSNVLVTRPLSHAELRAQGWTSRQMVYDTRNLLHYFRLMPDNRFLFGMRGGLVSSPAAESRARRRTLRDFRSMFPAWYDVDVPHLWSGMVCLARNRVPFAGPVPDHPGVFAGLAYHGNGVAMGSYTGRILADLVQGVALDLPYPRAMQRSPARFPLGRFRRALMPPIYAALSIADL